MQSLKEKKILIVEDDSDIIMMIEKFLLREGFIHVLKANTCEEAIEICFKNKPDIAILDIMLPDGDGFSLFSDIRQNSDIPILFLTARGEDDDKIIGLGLGADDYMVKPFLPKELILRVVSILKRVYGKVADITSDQVMLGSIMLDFGSASVNSSGETIQLTAKEYLLLKKLYTNKGKIVTTDSLCEALWGIDNFGYEKSLMVHVRNLREKIEIDPSNPVHLITVRGLGYKLSSKE